MPTPLAVRVRVPEIRLNPDSDANQPGHSDPVVLNEGELELCVRIGRKTLFALVALVLQVVYVYISIISGIFGNQVG